MGKIKGICKGLNKYFSQIFVVKEREIEIGYPTNVKHVAHIGWDGPSGSAPSWMDDYKPGPDFAASAIGKSGSTLSPWSSQDYGETMGRASEMFSDNVPQIEVPLKKQKRKKVKSGSSSASSSTTKPSRIPKSKTKFADETVKYDNYQVT